MTEKEGVRVDGDKELKQLKPFRDIIVKKNMIVDNISYLNRALKTGKRILAEGANACMLDIDFGTYPYVTSSPTTAAGLNQGLGIPFSAVETIIGIAKAYTTRVGEGPFPTEQKNEIGEFLQTKGFEFGATTGRKRRCGWLDIPVLRYCNMINNLSSINLTKLDVLTGLEEIKIGVNYKINGDVIDYIPSTIEELAKVDVDYITLPGWSEDISGITKYESLPKNAQKYIEKIEELIEVPITWIGTGADRDSIILREPQQQEKTCGCGCEGH